MKWNYKKDEHEIDREIKEHAQWCWVRMRITGRGSGN